MQFWKMNGAGNDFVVLNNLVEKLPEEIFPQVARTLCERHMSIGADGLMVVDAPTQGGDYKMLFFNSDGSIGEMCGNGARCICRYGYENGLAGEVPTVETPAGIVIADIQTNDGAAIAGAEIAVDGDAGDLPHLIIKRPHQFLFFFPDSIHTRFLDVANSGTETGDAVSVQGPGFQGRWHLRRMPPEIGLHAAAAG